MFKTNIIAKLLPHKRKCPGCGRVHRLPRHKRNETIICRLCGDEITVEDHLESLTLRDSRIVVFGMLFCLLAAVVLAGSDRLPLLGEREAEAVRIGVIVPSPIFENRSLIDAAVLAASEINTAGGFHGKAVEVLTGFSHGNPQRAVAEARRLVDEGVVSIIGPVLSAEAAHVASEVTNPLKMMNFSPGFEGVEDAALRDSEDLGGVLRSANSHIWRTVHWNRLEAEATSDYLYDDLGKRSVAVIYRDCPYGRRLAADFRQSFQGRGGKVLSFIGFPELPDYSKHDFSPAIKAALDKKPEVVYSICYVNDGLRIARQLPYTSLEPELRVYFWSSALYHESFLKNASSGIREYSYVVSGMFLEEDDGLREFSRGYLKLFGRAEKPSVFAPNAYDAAYLSLFAVAAAEAANDPHPFRFLGRVSSAGRRVRQNQFSKGATFMEKGLFVDYRGASGRLNLDRKGPETSKTYRIWRIKNNKFNEMAVKTYSGKNDGK